MFNDFDPENIQLKPMTLEQWVLSLPVGSRLITIHSYDKSSKDMTVVQTWLHAEDLNEMYLLSEKTT